MTAIVTPSVNAPVEHERLPWVPWMEGLRAKVLRCNLATNEYTLLIDFEPGVELPRHKHMGGVHAFTLSGRWHYLEYDWIAEAGSYAFEPAMSVHTLKVLDDNTENTLVLFTIQGGLVLLDDNDAVWWYEDAEGMLKLYRDGCEIHGLEFPEDAILWD